MKRLWALVRAEIKANFGIVVFFRRVLREKKDRWLLPLLVFSLPGLGILLRGLSHLIGDMYALLRPIGQQQAILGLGILAGQVVILVFGVYYVLSAFYFSRDLEMLIPMPVRPFELIAAKFLILVIHEYLTAAIIVLPFMINYGLLEHSGFGYWLSSLFVYLGLPIIPLVLVSLIVLPMMRCVHVGRKKDLLVTMGGVGLFVAVFAFQWLTARAQHPEFNDQEWLTFFSSPDGLLQKIHSRFPPAAWATRAAAGAFSTEGLSNLLGFIAVSLVLLGVLLALSEKLFYGGVIGLGETVGIQRSLTREEMSSLISSGKRAIRAIFIREFRIMNRTPVFFLNGVLITMIIPIFFVIMAKMNAPHLFESAARITGPTPSLPVILILALFMVTCRSLNGTASSTFSREGAQFWISRVIPVSPTKQVAAKFLHSYFVGSIAVFVSAAAILVCLPVPPSWVLFAAAFALAASAALTVLEMMIDLARPILDWTDPQKPIKQNLNVLLGMFADTAVLATVYFVIRLMTKAGFHDMGIAATAFAALFLFSLLCFFALCKFAHKRYAEIE